MNAEDENAPNDDAVVGIWFRRSALLALGLIIVLAGAWWWVSEPDADDSAPDASTQVPQTTLAGQSVRPIPEFRFLQESLERGLDFQFENGAYGERYLPETMVGGVGLFDFDSDGDLDILLAGGNRWSFDPKGARLDQTVGLFANQGDGQFIRVDRDLGLVTDAYVMGMAFGDPDGDGDPDIYLTTVGHNLLFENLSGTGFALRPDAGGAAGPSDWSTGASFFDANGDGWQDLVVVNYVQWSQALDTQADYQLAGLGRAYGPPTNFAGSLPRLYLNDGSGSFSDVSESAGFHTVPPSSAKSLAVLPRDFDRDGDTDLFVANDTTRNFLFVNNGSGIFTEEGRTLGVAFDNTGKSTGAMGVDLSYSADGTQQILAIGNFAGEMTSFYVSDSSSLNFADDAIISGVGPASRQALTFGLFFSDLDRDGFDDLVQVNGHVENLINRVQPSQTFAQPLQLFWHCDDGCPRAFVPVPAPGTGDLTNVLVGRGGAAGDIDGDGDLDLVLAQAGGSVSLLVNHTPPAKTFFRLRLVGLSPNVEALGAQVSVRSGNQLQRREISRTRSYLAQFDLTQVFAVDSDLVQIQVRWPDGTLSVHENITPERTLVIEHPER
ncbi:MAG: CRTAC1 family protein [Lysobacterales bacterium]